MLTRKMQANKQGYHICLSYICRRSDDVTVLGKREETYFLTMKLHKNVLFQILKHQLCANERDVSENIFAIRPEFEFVWTLLDSDLGLHIFH